MAAGTTILCGNNQLYSKYSYIQSIITPYIGSVHVKCPVGSLDITWWISLAKNGQANSKHNNSSPFIYREQKCSVEVRLIYAVCPVYTLCSVLQSTDRGWWQQQWKNMSLELQVTMPKSSCECLDSVKNLTVIANNYTTISWITFRISASMHLGLHFTKIAR